MHQWKTIGATVAAVSALAVAGTLGVALPSSTVPAAVAATDPCAPVTKTTNVPTTVPTTVPVTVTPSPTVDPTTGATTTPTPYPTTSPTTVATTVPSSSSSVPASCPIVPWLPGWRPVLGPVFNNPQGRVRDQMAIHLRARAAINHAPKGATIQLASYTYAFPMITKALIKAKKRGVRVQVIINGRYTSTDQLRLMKALGSNPNKRSFLVRCDGRCRKPGTDIGNQHAKVLAISRTGGARYYFMEMSGNFTPKAVSRQWNDSYAVSQDRALWDTWNRYFDQMKYQRRGVPRKIIYHQYTGDVSAVMQRKGSSAAETVSGSVETHRKAAGDLVLQRIKDVGCKPSAGYGQGGRTVIRIAMYAWFGPRTQRIGRALVAKKRQGCDIAILSSVGGNKTVTMLQRAGIPVKGADWMWTERDPAKEDGLKGWGPRYYLHTKFMIVDGRYQGRSTKMVWSGSETWSGASMGAEEVVLAVRSASAYNTYYKWWTKFWNSKAVHAPSLQPKGGPGRGPGNV